jgi:hypothetical protein
MTDITNRTTGSAAALPEDFAKRMMAGIAESRATTQMGAGGKPILRLIKGGTWLYGQTNEEMQPGSRWAVNVMTLAHGWCCWVEGESKNTLEGDIMVSMSEKLPAKPAPIRDTEFKEQRAFELKCMDGEDEGTEVVYKVNSYGGVQAVTALIGDIQRRLLTPYPCPVLTFDSEWYQHPKWGRVDKPIFTIVGWCDLNGNVEGEAAPPIAPASAATEPAPAPAAPARKRKPPLVTPAQVAAGQTTTAPPPPVEPAPVAQGHVGQRRRPVAR